MIQLRRSWYDILKPEFEKPYFKSLQSFLEEEYSRYAVYPSQEKIFNALNHLPLEKIKVVIIGQDPYHEPGQAQGLSFSVPDNFPLPPSLINIFKEIEDDLAIKCNPSGNLERWARQGVLLLNTVLTVRKGQANSHKDKGWETLTRKIIEIIGARKEPIVFLLWGSYAQSYAPLIASQHLVLKAPHPSPLSSYRGFFGCKHFSKCNNFLLSHGKDPINWQ
ncbi:MAG: uracil-DNA glycosylase [Clostridia bacterium]|nr:uracil-DNA glycosylase [Clostridia bacterium]